VGLGQGIHYCVGAPLTRLETQIAINTLLRRLPGLQLAVDVDRLEWVQDPTVHGLKSLPIVF
jgi:cytochrome P450